MKNPIELFPSDLIKRQESSTKDHIISSKGRFATCSLHTFCQEIMKFLSRSCFLAPLYGTQNAH